jgi:hypothetical protein
MLRSMRCIVEHLAVGNHTEKLKDISKQIDEYLLPGRADADDDI